MDALWFNITIPYGGKYSKDYIVNTLMAKIAPTVFIPLSYKVRGRDSSFFVDNFKVAEKLACVNKKITTITGHMLLVLVRPGLPYVAIDSTIKDKIRTVVLKRYDINLKALDLTHFHTDPDLIDNYALPLFIPAVMLLVLDIIVECVHDLEALYLSDNKLHSLDDLSVLSIKLPNLKVLRIGRNRIQDLQQLDCLESLPLEDLMLNGNPLRDKYQDHNAYIRDVKKRFPKLLKLDGVELSPPIKPDVSEPLQMPTINENCSCPEEGRSFVHQFLAAYYQLYDNNNREQLAGAYLDNSMLSLTSTYVQDQSSENTSELVKHVTESLNFLSVKDDSRGQKSSYQGKRDIIACLSKLPKTQHVPNSFVTNLKVFTPQVILMSLTGLFWELGPTGKQLLRSFSRDLVIVPHGQGHCIMNEELSLTCATDNQTEVGLRTSGPAEMLPSTTRVTVAASRQVELIDDGMKQRMVDGLAAQTGMNMQWARKCLHEGNWDIQQTIYMLIVISKQGTIPAEAFVK